MFLETKLIALEASLRTQISSCIAMGFVVLEVAATSAPMKIVSRIMNSFFNQRSFRPALYCTRHILTVATHALCLVLTEGFTLIFIVS